MISNKINSNKKIEIEFERLKNKKRWNLKYIYIYNFIAYWKYKK
jgi:hypothetical protein